MPVEKYKVSSFEIVFCGVVGFQLVLSMYHDPLHWFTIACAPFQVWCIGLFLFAAVSWRAPLWLDFGVQSLFLGVCLAGAFFHPHRVAISLGTAALLGLLAFGTPSLFRADVHEVRNPIHGLVVAGTLIPTAEIWSTAFLSPFSIPGLALLIVFCVMRTSWLVFALRAGLR